MLPKLFFFQLIQCGLLFLPLIFVHLGWATPSVPYMPSWEVRHALAVLSDEANLPITTSHWPLPMYAVQNALDKLPKQLPDHLEDLRDMVVLDLKRFRSNSRLDLQLRTKADGPVAFGENYTPGNSFKASTPVLGGGSYEVVSKLGIKIEQNPNSLKTDFAGFGSGSDSSPQIRPDDSALVIENWGMNFQVFAHQIWWGPSWQSTLTNSNNSPPWTGIGIQRSQVTPSSSPWLSWLGPWNAEWFVARAQDPTVVSGQLNNFYYTGMRFTAKPFRWLEIAASKGMQSGGAGTNYGLNSYLKNVLGQGNHPTNPNADSSAFLAEDSANSIAGFDARISCPYKMGCNLYFESQGEDGSGGNKLPWPNRFLSLSGLESWSKNGRHRYFLEFMQSYCNSWPGDNKGTGCAYTNWAYPQGETNGARWLGSSFGADARVLTLGWLDAKERRSIKVFNGQTSTSVGAYNPSLVAPHGGLIGFTANQKIDLKDFTLSPEITFIKFDQGSSQGNQKLNNLRLGIGLQKYF